MIRFLLLAGIKWTDRHQYLVLAALAILLMSAGALL